MKLLKIKEGNGYFLNEKNEDESIVNIKNDDILRLLLYIYENDAFEIDEISENNRINHDVQKLIYSNLQKEFEKFNLAKKKLKVEIENKFSEITEKYKNEI